MGKMLTRAQWWVRMQKRFWSKVDVQGPSDCWPWTASTYGGGYGQFVWFAGKIIGAHRAAFIIAHRRCVEPGKCILHRCDNPLCCNSKHLYEGTLSENSLDAVRRNRYPQIKLNASKVRAMRILHTQGFSQCSIATVFGTSQTNARRIIEGKTWKHVE